MANDERIIRAFCKAALFLKDRCEQDGWSWSSNFLREYVRCATGESFTNTKSPFYLREVVKRHPELDSWIKLGARAA